jgi:hypothetical protein
MKQALAKGLENLDASFVSLIDVHQNLDHNLQRELLRLEFPIHDTKGCYQ